MNALFQRANLRRVDFTEAVAAYSDFSFADLREANFEGADLGGASFKEANLCGANLLSKRIVDADFSEATYDDFTIWPEGFVPVGASNKK